MNRQSVDKRAVVTPAMEAGIEDHVWSIEELVLLLEERLLKSG